MELLIKVLLTKKASTVQKNPEIAQETLKAEASMFLEKFKASFKTSAINVSVLIVTTD